MVYNPEKFFSRRIPHSWLFSGWNCTPYALPLATPEEKIPW
jgi:hypothetical protein